MKCKSVSVVFLRILLLALSILAFSGCQSRMESENEALSEDQVDFNPRFSRVSIHDPSHIFVDDWHYIFGSHIVAAKSQDLMHWQNFANGYMTPGNVLFGDLSENLAQSFLWAGEDDADSKGGFNVWAPDVIYNPDFIHEDGSQGAYLMYYSVSSTWNRSAIGFASSKNIEGPYTYVDSILYSGFTKISSFDQDSEVDKKWTNTHLPELIEADIIKSVNPDWFRGDTGYNTSLFPNAIDPALFYDAKGQLWLVYGSWSGGIFLLEIEPTTGKPKYPGYQKAAVTEVATFGDGMTGLWVAENFVDGYFGTRIAGGQGRSGEGPYVVYDPETGYYYLFSTYGSLQATGGYNMRMFRSKSPDGPYLDASGRSAVLLGESGDAHERTGIKLMGNYAFAHQNRGFRAPGHNTVLMQDQQWFNIFHTRFNQGNEFHEVRVHQMFAHPSGWLVMAPYEYTGDLLSEAGYALDDITRPYEMINHGRSNQGEAMLQSQWIQLEADGRVTGDIEGVWTYEQGTPYMTITYGGITYEGLFFKQKNDANDREMVMTFSAIGTNNQVVWGSTYKPKDVETRLREAFLSLSLPMYDTITENLVLPTVEDEAIQINWSVPDDTYIKASGEVIRPSVTVGNQQVTLIAQLILEDQKRTKTFTFIIGAMNE